jgi:hypothetical protein
VLGSSLAKLVEIGSPQIAPLEEGAVRAAAELLNGCPGLAELYAAKNGLYAFESSLHVFPCCSGNAPADLVTWNAEGLWRAEYANMAAGLIFFAEDVFGDQFCFKDARIYVFHSETGEVEFMAEDLENWAQIILADYQFWTAYPLAHDWQALHGPLKKGHRLSPKIPFVMGGDYEVDFLYSIDSIEAMRFRASIAMQIRNLPDGSKVKLIVKERP